MVSRYFFLSIKKKKNLTYESDTDIYMAEK